MPGYRSLLLKVACDAVPAVEVTGLTVRYGPAGTPAAVDGLDLAGGGGRGARRARAQRRRQDVDRRDARGLPAPGRRPGAGARARSPWPTTPRSAGASGSCSNAAACTPCSGRAGCCTSSPATTPRPSRPTSCSTSSGCARVAAHAVAPPLGRRAATALARPGPGRPARGGLPRRADGRGRPRGPHRRARRGGRAEGEGRLRCPHHPRAGRGREDGGPHRDPLRRPRRPGGDAAGPRPPPGRGRRRPAVVTFGAPAALDVAALAAAVGPGTTAVETAPGRYRVEAVRDAETPAVTAAVANFLAARGATLTDLVVGKTLEDVYFETVGAAAGRGRLRDERRRTRPSRGPAAPAAAAGDRTARPR